MTNYEKEMAEMTIPRMARLRALANQYNEHSDDFFIQKQAWINEVNWLNKEVEPEIKPCPFCSGKGDIYKKEIPVPFFDFGEKMQVTRDVWVADCSVCDCVIGERFKTREEAIEAWNRRV